MPPVLSTPPPRGANVSHEPNLSDLVGGSPNLQEKVQLALLKDPMYRGLNLEERKGLKQVLEFANKFDIDNALTESELSNTLNTSMALVDRILHKSKIPPDGYHRVKDFKSILGVLQDPISDFEIGDDMRGRIAFDFIPVPANNDKGGVREWAIETGRICVKKAWTNINLLKGKARFYAGIDLPGANSLREVGMLRAPDYAFITSETSHGPALKLLMTTAFNCAVELGKRRLAQ